MSTASAFFAAQAAKCGKEAAETTLSNVRERALRSQAAWQVLLDREDASIAGRIGRKPWAVDGSPA